MKLEPLIPSGYYHFFNRGNNKENIFIEEVNKFFFLQLMEKYLLSIADIYSYCLLENHFHLVIKIKDEEDLPQRILDGNEKLSQSFSNMFNAYSKTINKGYNRTGSLFQKHPRRIKIDSKEYLVNLIIYVNTNSDKHGIADFKKYKFSSYQAIISNKTTSIKRDVVIELFGGVSEFKTLHMMKKMNMELLSEIIEDDF